MWGRPSSSNPGAALPDEPAARLHAVRARVDAAARAWGRDPNGVTLIAVSKTHGAEAIRPLLDAGQRDFGENRVAEAAAKWPLLRADFPDARLHMVGALQSNKAAGAAALFNVIHSVDRPSLIAALGAAKRDAGRQPECFLQVNIGDEPQKAGCAPGEIGALLEAARGADLEMAGLMCLPPQDVEPAPYFALLAKLAGEHGLPGLSMGMSGDYETAVSLGATHVRVGTALFGARA